MYDNKKPVGEVGVFLGETKLVIRYRLLICFVLSLRTLREMRKKIFLRSVFSRLKIFFLRKKVRKCRIKNRRQRKNQGRY